MMKIIMQPGNSKLLGEGAMVGLALGGIGLLFNNCMEKTTIDTEDSYFINRNDDIAQPFLKLKHFLSINGSDHMDSMSSLQHKLNIIAGCDELTDHPDPYPLHLTYTVNEISNSIKLMLDKIIHAKFRIPTLGIEICTCIEELTQVIENIKHNVLQETNLRVMNNEF